MDGTSSYACSSHGHPAGGGPRILKCHVGNFLRARTCRDPYRVYTGICTAVQLYPSPTAVAFHLGPHVSQASERCVLSAEQDERAHLAQGSLTVRDPCLAMAL
jgi:hypothetical protein